MMCFYNLLCPLTKQYCQYGETQGQILLDLGGGGGGGGYKTVIVFFHAVNNLICN